MNARDKNAHRHKHKNLDVSTTTVNKLVNSKQDEETEMPNPITCLL